MKNPEPRVGRWQLFLNQFDFKVVHKKGYGYSDADALSRAPVTPAPPLGEEDIFEVSVDSRYIVKDIEIDESHVDESASPLVVSAAGSTCLDLQICEETEELVTNSKTTQAALRISERLAKKRAQKRGRRSSKTTSQTGQIETNQNSRTRTNRKLISNLLRMCSQLR